MVCSLAETLKRERDAVIVRSLPYMDLEKRSQATEKYEKK